MRLLLWLVMSAMIVTAARAQEPAKAQVMVIPSMHRLHAERPTYSYDRLYETVRAFEPDLVGVEIRAEDIGMDEAYIAANYPLEMVVLAREYGPRAFGFDWLGAEFEGRPLPEQWAAQTAFVRLQRAQREDPRYAHDAELDRLRADKTAETEVGVTVGSLSNGPYDELNTSYYRRLEDWLAGSPYAGIAEFSRARDSHIDLNLINFIRANPGKRIAIVLGADHRSFAIAAIRAELSEIADLVPIP